MCNEEKVNAVEMTAEELENYLKEPISRGEMYQGLQIVRDEELLPEINGKYAFLINLMRYMFAASGAMAPDIFNETYQKYVDAFTEKYGGQTAEKD